MGKEIINKFNNKRYLFILIILLFLTAVGIVGRLYLVQRSIDRCYSEAKQRFEDAWKEVPKIQECPEWNKESRFYPICDWVEDVDAKLKLKDQLGEDEERCLRRYR